MTQIHSSNLDYLGNNHQILAQILIFYTLKAFSSILCISLRLWTLKGVHHRHLFFLLFQINILWMRKKKNLLRHVFILWFLYVDRAFTLIEKRKRALTYMGCVWAFCRWGRKILLTIKFEGFCSLIKSHFMIFRL